jgi:hypothetical protein
VITTSGRHSSTSVIQCFTVAGSSRGPFARFWRTVAQRWISPSFIAKLGPKISSTRGSLSLRYRKAAPEATTRTSWAFRSASMTTCDLVAWPMPSPLTP